MKYNEIVEYILNIPRFKQDGYIENRKRFYEYLKKPGENSMIIHVAGTNGKGSTCAYMNSVLTQAGFEVGMFTSPHLVSMTERIRRNQKLISQSEFELYFHKLMQYIEEYNQKTESGMKQEFNPTFFEFLFFMAMLYFEDKKPDVIILETGLGGRLDATNVIASPKVAVITEIGKDHMEYLGNTYEKIAEEKAGIIKKGCTVVYSANRQETAQIIEKKAKELGVLCKSVEKIGKEDYRFVDKKIDFSYFSRYYGCIPITLNTCAVYQVENAKMALTALEATGLPISGEAMQKGMEQCRWEGRMEEIIPKVYLDGAHNEDGIDAFIESVNKDGATAKRWLLFSVVADKEYYVMKEKLIKSELFDHVLVAPLKNVRGITRIELENIFADTKVEISNSVCEGLQEILSRKEEKDLVYVTGSLYLVGEIKEHFGGNYD